MHRTYRIYNDNLFSLCQRFKIPLNHHEALSDARACAKLFLLNLRNS
jgi:DNA polymerase III subunit epsilon